MQPQGTCQMQSQGLVPWRACPVSRESPMSRSSLPASSTCSGEVEVWSSDESLIASGVVDLLWGVRGLVVRARVRWVGFRVAFRVPRRVVGRRRRAWVDVRGETGRDDEAAVC